MDPEPARKPEYKVNISRVMHFVLLYSSYYVLLYNAHSSNSKEVKHGRLINAEYCQRHKTFLKCQLLIQHTDKNTTFRQLVTPVDNKIEKNLLGLPS
jgi:hypothetical protein